MIPQYVTQKEYDAIPDTHVHLTDDIEVIHKHPRMGVAALNAKIKDGWNICLKDGSPADDDEVKRVKAFVKKVVDTDAKREKKRLADLAKQTDRAKFTSADLDAANEARDEAINALEEANDAAEAAQAKIKELEADTGDSDAVKEATDKATGLATDLKAADVQYATEKAAREKAETELAELKAQLAEAKK